MQIAAEKARQLGSVAAIYVETPANPTNGIVDIAAARVLAERLATDGRRLPLIVDNTFLGPLYQTPLALGADIVVTSLNEICRRPFRSTPLLRVAVRDQRQCCNRFAACEQFYARCATLTLVGC